MCREILEIHVDNEARDMLAWLEPVSLKIHGEIAELVRADDIVRLEAMVEPLFGPSAADGAAFV